MNTSPDKNRSRNTTDETAAAGPVRHIQLQKNRIDSADLFIDTREIVLAHGDETYRLRLTAQNKLILTK